MTAAGEGGRALVVFSGKADLPWLRLLRPGFRHCFVLVEQPQGWLCVNPLAHRTTVEIWEAAPAAAVTDWLVAREGLTVVETRLRLPPRRPCPIGIFSCVEAVKRVLGLHERWLLTPGQLYDHLTEKGRNSLTVTVMRTILRTSTPQPCPNAPAPPAGRRLAGRGGNKT